MTHTCTKTHRCRGQSWGRKAGKGSFALAGFPTDQARATLEPDGPKMLNIYDGSFQGVWGLMVGSLWEGMKEFILNWGNPSRLESNVGDSGRSPLDH